MVKVNWRAKVKNENRIKFFYEKVTPGFEGNLSKREAIQKDRLLLGKKVFKYCLSLKEVNWYNVNLIWRCASLQFT